MMVISIVLLIHAIIRNIYFRSFSLHFFFRILFNHFLIAGRRIFVETVIFRCPELIFQIFYANYLMRNTFES